LFHIHAAPTQAASEQPVPGEPAHVAFQMFEFVPEIELPFASTFQLSEI
jgi:hypothetical protein